jgi:hypothetical protein
MGSRPRAPAAGAGTAITASKMSGGGLGGVQLAVVVGVADIRRVRHPPVVVERRPADHRHRRRGPGAAAPEPRVVQERGERAWVAQPGRTRARHAA